LEQVRNALPSLISSRLGIHDSVTSDFSTAATSARSRSFVASVVVVMTDTVVPPVGPSGTFRQLHALPPHQRKTASGELSTTVSGPGDVEVWRREPYDPYVASLFLAGPNPRSAGVSSWRPAALKEITAPRRSPVRRASSEGPLRRE
jgi:hypothetical protein